jgi:hypothetical protein
MYATFSRHMAAAVALLLAIVTCLILSSTSAFAASRPTPTSALAGVPSFQRALVSQALLAATGDAASNLEAQSTCAAPKRDEASCYAEALKVKSSGRWARPKMPRHPAFPSLGVGGSLLSAPALSVSPASILPNTEPTTTTLPTVGTPAYMQQAYDLTGLSATQGSSDTIAIVDVGADPTAAADLATYRSYFNLPACTEASGCLTVVNQDGQTQAQAGSAWPAENDSWQAEESLDLDAVTALCPLCHILFVQANSNSNSDLNAAESRAADWPGVTAISDSWGEYSSTPVNEFDYPGVAVFASTGDDGYSGNTPNWPAASPYVTAVGGTTLSQDKTGTVGNRGYLETSWDDAGSGCATTLAVPSYQAGLTTGCAGRAVADVSADANPITGLAVYSGYYGGWTVVGGTSLASPLTAAFTTVAGINADSPSWAYGDASGLDDMTSGTNVGQPGDTEDTTDCGDALCHAGTGWDGITGVGSIDGAVAITAQAPGISGAGDCANVCAPSGDFGYISGATSTTLQLAAQVQTNGLATTYYWEYGTSAPPSGATDSTTTSLVASSSPEQAALSLTGLTPGTDYYYRLVASNSVGTTYGYTYEAETPASAPTMTSAPYISGTAQQGNELSFQAGAWTGSPTDYAYTWYENKGSGWQEVSGSGTTNQVFYLGASDVGAEFEGVITVSNSDGSSTYTTATVGPVTSGAPAISGTPAITGDDWVGVTMTAQTGTWSAPASVSFSYQWQADESGTWTNIAGATSATYSPIVAEIGEELQVIVTATDTYGSTTAVSDNTSTIAAGTPRNVSLPLVSGTAQRLATLSATAGGWDWTGYSHAYQWQRCSGGTCSDIGGATNSTYQPTVADEGDTLDVVVTASDPNGSASAASAPSATVAANLPSQQSAPTISGSQADGFTATAGSWSPSDVTTSYQWQRCNAGGNNCSDIGGATSASYTAQDADVGDDLRVLITATNPDGSAAATTPNTAAIDDPNPPTNTSVPSITGTTQVGQPLTGSAGQWSPSRLTFSYQWQDCSGATCSYIPGATDANYTVQASDEGDTIELVVTGTDGVTEQTVTSAATATVVAAPVDDGGSASNGSGTGTTSTSTPPSDVDDGSNASSGGGDGGTAITPAPSGGGGGDTTTTPTPTRGSDNHPNGSGTSVDSGASSAGLSIRASGGLPDGLGLIGETLSWTVRGAQAASATAAKLIRCLSTCAAVETGTSYTIRQADAGTLLRLAATASGQTAYGSSVIGPVVTAQVAGARIKRGTVGVRTADHIAYATARLATVRHGKTTTTTIAVTRRMDKGSLTTWACPVALSKSGKPTPCTRHQRLAKTTSIKVAGFGTYAVIVAR